MDRWTLDALPGSMGLGSWPLGEESQRRVGSGTLGEDSPRLAMARRPLEAVILPRTDMLEMHVLHGGPAGLLVIRSMGMTLAARKSDTGVVRRFQSRTRSLVPPIIDWVDQAGPLCRFLSDEEIKAPARSLS
jgi:hypothetical protein